MSSGIASLHSEQPLKRLRDIVDNIRNIESYTRRLDFADFQRTQIVIDAVERCLTRISEASVKIGPIAEDILPGQNWRGMRGIGNHIRHDYDNVADEANWAIVKNRLPSLLDDIERFLSGYPHGQDHL